MMIGELYRNNLHFQSDLNHKDHLTIVIQKHLLYVLICIEELIFRNMKNIYIVIASFSLAVIISSSCTTTKPVAEDTVVDLVCEMKVNKSESYSWKYDGKKYYFDSYNCRESFKVNPKNFLEKKCVPNDNIIDLVCGTKVKLSESFDYKFGGRVYHFHSYECKQAFKMNPEKFLKNKCAPTDSIK